MKTLFFLFDWVQSQWRIIIFQMILNALSWDFFCFLHLLSFLPSTTQAFRFLMPKEKTKPKTKLWPLNVDMDGSYYSVQDWKESLSRLANNDTKKLFLNLISFNRYSYLHYFAMISFAERPFWKEALQPYILFKGN